MQDTFYGSLPVVMLIMYFYVQLLLNMIYQLPLPQDFEHQIDGKNTHLITLRNRSGMQVAFTDYGARIVSILVPDSKGDLRDVCLGFNNIHDYLKADEQYHGATIGRYANRIAKGQFSLADENFTLAQNERSNCLHGGPKGFHNQVWDRQVSFKKLVNFYYTSPDGEEGFPGNLQVNICYELTEENEIIICYKAKTDKKTVINLTNHAYFNLNGEGSGDILSHDMQSPATHYLPIDELSVPLGTEAAVAGTAFDFREAKKLGQDISNDAEQLVIGKGYDHAYVNAQPYSQPAARVHSASSGISLEVYTTEPSFQLYTGNHLSGKDLGKSGKAYAANSGFCIETQHYPDSPNQPNFPSVVLAPGDTFESHTIYKFNVQK